jgi:DNA-binding response OmpR family regulator
MATILIVDDEAPLRQLLAETVGTFGYDVMLAGTAADALALAELQRPDAILLDIALPDARGTSVLERLRALRKDVPVIVVTANTDEEVARETLRRGTVDYVMKPFTVERIKAVLEAALRRWYCR